MYNNFTWFTSLSKQFNYSVDLLMLFNSNTTQRICLDCSVDKQTLYSFNSDKDFITAYTTFITFLALDYQYDYSYTGVLHRADSHISLLLPVVNELIVSQALKEEIKGMHGLRIFTEVPKK